MVSHLVCHQDAEQMQLEYTPRDLTSQKRTRQLLNHEMRRIADTRLYQTT